MIPYSKPATGHPVHVVRSLKTIALLPTFEPELIDVSPISSSRMAMFGGGGPFLAGVAYPLECWVSNQAGFPILVMGCL